jgi:uncharacterized protein YktA (UPF0223 family)
MPTANFYLKKAEPGTTKHLIYLQFKFNSQKVVFTFNQLVEANDWNKDKQRIKPNKRVMTSDGHLVNDLLDNLAKNCERAYNQEVAKGIPRKEVITGSLKAFMNQNAEDPSKETLLSLVDRFINNEITHKGRAKSSNTLKTYKSFKGHLEAFEKDKRVKLDFEDITLDFYHKFTNHLKSKELGVNAISKYIQILKVVMGEAVDLGFTQNYSFRHKKFAVVREDTHAVYLTEKEIIKLYKTDLSEDRKLENAKDLFVFGAFVGLRFSDYSQVKPENIIALEGERYIQMKTKKTGEKVLIPCHEIVEEIFSKYKDAPNKLPRVAGNTDDSKNALFNRYIKEACKIADLTEKGRLVTEPEKELWECVGSHTARRSFATNYYLQDFPIYELMKITGHRTEKSFRNYIKVNTLQAAKKLGAHFKKNWNRALYQLHAA